MRWSSISIHNVPVYHEVHPATTVKGVEKTTGTVALLKDFVKGPYVTFRPGSKGNYQRSVCRNLTVVFMVPEIAFKSSPEKIIEKYISFEGVSPGKVVVLLQKINGIPYRGIVATARPHLRLIYGGKSE